MFLVVGVVKHYIPKDIKKAAKPIYYIINIARHSMIEYLSTYISLANSNLI